MLSFAVIFILGAAFLQPFSFSENTNAVTERTTNGDYYLETTATDLNLTIETTPAGNQISSSHDVTVKTDDPAGYTLTVSVNNDTSNALNLNGNTSATEKFVATSGTYDNPKALDENSWGFADTLTKSTNNQWAAVPLLSNAQQLKSTSSANESGDTTTVYYAINAKYDGAHSNGNYSNTITYSVVGNTVPRTTLKQAAATADITTMQTMTRDICASADIYQEGDEDLTLKDSRDQKEYKIRKLADGNCWMVQNLRLVVSSETTFKNTNTNVSKDTKLPAANTSFCASNNAACYNILNHMDSGNTEYGAYYSWSAATLNNTAGSVSSGNVETSICPSSGTGYSYADSWHIPSGNTNGEWNNMMTKYTDGVSDFIGSSQNTRRNFTDSTITGTANSYGDYTPNFPFSGSRDGTSTNGRGSYGSFWSSTASSTGNAYRALVNSDGYVYAGTLNYFKRLGYSVRCVLTSS